MLGDCLCKIQGAELAAPVGLQSVPCRLEPLSLSLWTDMIQALENCLDQLCPLEWGKLSRLDAQFIYFGCHLTTFLFWL